MNIELDSSLDLKDTPDAISLVTDRPVTIKAAIRLMLFYARVYEYEMRLAADAIRVVSPGSSEREFVLRTHDLRSASDFSTLMRKRFVDEVKKRVEPEAWGQINGPWIVPGSSVFSVDVYHRPEVQRQVALLWREEYLKGLDQGQRFGETPLPNLPTSIDEMAEAARILRGEFPIESLDDRLSYEIRRPPANPQLTSSALRRLDRLEIERANADQAMANPRSLSLRRLHEMNRSDYEEFFTGKGYESTISPPPGPAFLSLEESPEIQLPAVEIPPVQPDLSTGGGGQQDSGSNVMRVPSPDELTSFHDACEAEFLAPQRFGYVQERRRVAGFVAHTFSSLPRLEDQLPWYSEPTEHWALCRLEFISLARFVQPRAYVSPGPPRMDKLSGVPTRDLGKFENKALQQLARGEDVVSQIMPNRVDMLGALRATKSCLDCHEAHRGQLLGAFSYTFVRDPQIPPGATD